VNSENLSILTRDKQDLNEEKKAGNFIDHLTLLKKEQNAKRMIYYYARDET
jgi:hypothetical protein